MATELAPLASGNRVESTSARGLVEITEPSAEPFRSLRLSLDLRPDLRRGNLIVFTSSDPREGKSTIAANYALVAATTEQRVLLVDADLRSPVVHEIFGLPRVPGLTDVLGVGDDVKRLTFPATHGVRISGQRLDILAAGTPMPQAGDLTATRAVRDRMAAMCESYDLVVVDTPPVLATSDAAHLAAQEFADVAFVVDHKTHTRRVRRALKRLELAGANVVGLVLNHEGRLSEYGYS